MFSSVDFWITCFISSWEESNYILCKAEQIKKVALKIVLDEVVVILSETSCHFVNLLSFKQQVVLFSAGDKSRDPGATWNKQEHM